MAKTRTVTVAELIDKVQHQRQRDYRNMLLSIFAGIIVAICAIAIFLWWIW